MDFSKMSKDELMEVWSRYHRASRKDAEAIVGDRRPGYTNRAADLANYACNVAVSLRCKADGKADTAKMYADIARRIWARLPSNVQARHTPHPKAR